MILSKGHTGQIKGQSGQIKGQSLLGDYDLQGAVKWSHEGIRYFLIKYDLYLSERNCVVYR